MPVVTPGRSVAGTEMADQRGSKEPARGGTGEKARARAVPPGGEGGRAVSRGGSAPRPGHGAKGSRRSGGAYADIQDARPGQVLWLTPPPARKRGKTGKLVLPPPLEADGRPAGGRRSRTRRSRGGRARRSASQQGGSAEDAVRAATAAAGGDTPPESAGTKPAGGKRPAAGEAREVRVLNENGEELPPGCSLARARREVALGRAKWVGKSTIRLRYNPFRARRILKRVIARDKNICAWCGGPGDTVDHLLPWSKGGRTTMPNCVCSCYACNQKRADTPVEEFIRREGITPTNPVVLAFLAANAARKDEERVV